MKISLVEMLTNIVQCILYHSTHKAGLNWESRRLQGGGGGGGDGGGGDGGGGGGGCCCVGFNDAVPARCCPSSLVS